MLHYLTLHHFCPLAGDYITANTEGLGRALIFYTYRAMYRRQVPATSPTIYLNHTITTLASQDNKNTYYTSAPFYDDVRNTIQLCMAERRHDTHADQCNAALKSALAFIIDELQIDDPDSSNAVDTEPQPQTTDTDDICLLD